MANIFKDKESFERFKQSVYQSQSPEALTQRIRPGGSHWYIFGITPEGKQMTLGPRDTEAEVIRIGDEQNLVGPQDDEPYTYELDTIDLNSAIRKIKADLLDRGISTGQVLRRFKHK